MDSHILRKAAARLPALADLAVLRFNTRGTTSPRGTSEGSFGEGVAERADVAAAMAFVAERGLPNPWLVGWSFGTELALKYGLEHGIAGAVLLSPPLHRTTDEELRRWNGSPAPIVALIPEHDDYLRPAEAAERFAVLPRLRRVDVEGGRHLWVGESQTRRVLDEIVAAVNPAACRCRPRGRRPADVAPRHPCAGSGAPRRASELVLARDHDLLDDQQDRRGDGDRDRARRGCRAACRPRAPR